MESIWRDVRFFLRTLRRNPGFGITAIVILALGIGATTTIFSVFNSVLLRPLAYPEPSRLVAVTSAFGPRSENRIAPMLSPAEVETWRDNSRTLESLGGFSFTRVPVRAGDEAYLPDTAFAEPALFTTLRVQPAIGTLFVGDAAEDFPTVVISHRFWERAFNADPDVIGKPLFVSGRDLIVRGVLAPDFVLPRPDARLYRGPVDVFLPAFREFSADARLLWTVGRLRPGVSIEQAEAELGTIDTPVNPAIGAGWSARLTPLAEERTEQSRQPLAIFLAIAAVLLTIACTNLTSLLLSRSAARSQEMVVRRAIGGTGGRLIRQQLTESLCLSLLGGLLGLGIALVAIRFVETMSPLRLPITGGITIDATVLAFMFLVCVAASIGAGLLPAVFSTAIRPSRGRGFASGVTARAYPRMQTSLSITQIALSVGLLAAAGVLAHSLWRLNTLDPGFERERMLGFVLTVPRGPPDYWVEYVSRALEALETTPGVDAAGFITFLPPETWAGHFRPFSFDGPAPETRPGQTLFANTLMTSAGYFGTAGMTVIRGRSFRETDDQSGPPVMIVNEAFARTHFPDDDPLGKRIASSFDQDEKVREIVGIVNDTRDRGFRDAPVPTIYLPFRQGTLPYGGMALRTTAAPESVVPEIRQRLRAIDPDVPAVDFETLDERVYESLREPRFYAVLAIICAAMATIFVTVGIYGVVSYSVSRRTLEFGIRMALGSSAGGILRNVLAQGARMTAAGVALGMLIAIGSTRFLASFLFEVEPIDAPTLAAAAVLATAATLVAAYVPARRAYRQAPTAALRYE